MLSWEGLLIYAYLLLKFTHIYNIMASNFRYNVERALWSKGDEQWFSRVKVSSRIVMKQYKLWNLYPIALNTLRISQSPRFWTMLPLVTPENVHKPYREKAWIILEIYLNCSVETLVALLTTTNLSLNLIHDQVDRIYLMVHLDDERNIEDEELHSCDGLNAINFNDVFLIPCRLWVCVKYLTVFSSTWRVMLDT